MAKISCGMCGANLIDKDWKEHRCDSIRLILYSKISLVAIMYLVSIVNILNYYFIGSLNKYLYSIFVFMAIISTVLFEKYLENKLYNG